jgi:rare lipoprotein A
VWFVLLGFLVGCQTNPTHQGSEARQKNVRKKTSDQQDGAPSGPLPAFFKKVFPMNEPFSRYGNPDTYRVDGRTYQVMRSAHGYHARGLASWYGTKFHSQRTSSGEAYDMYALTAAHKTLPLPTYIRVKNLSNGRVAIVKVNDRGPFHSNRILDLSYAAAVKLGVYPKGTAPVEIEALSAKGANKAHVARYYVQAGAFRSSVLAGSLRRQILTLTRTPVLIERYQKQYIVKVGPFANKRMADHFKIMLSRKGVRGTFTRLL